DGNAAPTCTTTVTVDATPPTIVCPQNIITNITSNSTYLQGCSIPVKFNVSAFDNCTEKPLVTCSPASGSSFQRGTTRVLCTARDAVSNAASCSFTVTVIDSAPPTLICPPNIVTTLQSGQVQSPVSFPAPSATDNCPGV